MDEFWDIFLVFASIVAMIIGAVSKDKKKRTSRGPVATGTGVPDFDEDNDVFEPEPEPVSRAGWEPAPEREPVRPAARPVADIPDEGTSGVTHHSVPVTQDEKKPFRIDKKKLVLYHEIMKPKFDE